MNFKTPYSGVSFLKLWATRRSRGLIQLTVASSIFFSACGKDRLGVATSPKPTSEISYVQLSVPRHTPFEPCVLKKIDQNQKVTAYLGELMNHLSAGNDIFSGQFSPRNFCLGLLSSAGINGTSYSNSGTVLFSKTVFQEMEPISILAMLAHESAHILLRHAESPPLPDATLLNDEAYNRMWLKLAPLEKSAMLGISKKFARISQRLLELKENDLGQLARFQATSSHNYAVESARRTDDVSMQPESYHYNVQLDQNFWDKMSGHPDEQVKRIMEEQVLPSNQLMEYNGMQKSLEAYAEKSRETSAKEEQADAVGMILFIKSGFSIKQYEAVFERMVALQYGEKDKEKCLTMISNKQEPPKFGALSSRSHPSLCWRLFHLRHQLRPNLEAKNPELAKTPNGQLKTATSLRDVQDTL
jgi:hypothetical protein